VASTPKPLGLVVLVLASLCLGGCADSLTQSKQLALDAASTQVIKLKENAADVASASSSAADLLGSLKSGSVGTFFPDPVPPDLGLPGPTFSVVSGAVISSDSVKYGAIVEATGESGGGGTYHQSSVFLCLEVSSSVGADSKTSVRDSACRADILSVLLKRDGNTPIRLNDIPAARAPS